VCVCVCVCCVCVFVRARACIRVFFTRHANRTFSAPYYAVIRGLSGTAVFFYMISQKPGISETIMEHKMRVLIFSATLSESFLIIRGIQNILSYIFIRFHVNHPLFFSYFNET